jgi:hypothetical protein
MRTFNHRRMGTQDQAFDRVNSLSQSGGVRSDGLLLNV